ncbi:MAG: pyridoxamine 5'-phosphate oxidase family protein [Cytophagales bacterium]|nr:pyridoxamine 5'-phosphate oxidase family protein [Cytophagales bacterium]
MSTYEKTHVNKVKRGPNRAIYDQDEIYKIIDSQMICHVGYVYEGTPITIPTGYGRIENTLYLHGSMKNRMLLGIAALEQASVTITHLDGLVLARSVFHHSVNYRSAVIFGKPHIVTERNEKMKALEVITENFITGRWEEARQPNEKEFEATLVIAVPIESASAKVRSEGVNDEKSDLELDIWAGVVPLEMVARAPITEPDLKEGISVPDSVRKFKLT